MTWEWFAPLRVSEGQGRNNFYKGGGVLLFIIPVIQLHNEFLLIAHGMSIDFRE